MISPRGKWASLYLLLKRWIMKRRVEGNDNACDFFLWLVLSFVSMCGMSEYWASNACSFLLSTNPLPVHIVWFRDLLYKVTTVTCVFFTGHWFLSIKAPRKCAFSSICKSYFRDYLPTQLGIIILSTYKQCFINISKSSQHPCEVGKYCYPHFTGEETDTRRGQWFDLIVVLNTSQIMLSVSLGASGAECTLHYRYCVMKDSVSPHNRCRVSPYVYTVHVHRSMYLHTQMDCVAVDAWIITNFSVLS